MVQISSKNSAVKAGLSPWRQTKAFRLGLWLLGLLVGSILIFGRYDWNEGEGSYAIRGYLSSLYFFWFFLPTTYYLILLIFKKPRLALSLTWLLFLIYTLPYNWLGLARWRYNLVLLDATSAKASVPWLPEHFGEEVFPGDKLLLGSTLLIFGLVAFLFSLGAEFDLKKARVALWRSSPFILAFFVILVQIWLHASLRSPHTYLNYYVSAEANQGQWYHVYLLGPGQGAANGDESWFSSLDNHFNGYPRGLITILLRRSFTSYLSAPFTYFWNNFYVYIVLNSLFWLGGVVCTYYYFIKVLGKPKVALYAAALVCCGNGFIAVAAQPMSYVAGSSAVIFSFYLYEVLLVPEIPVQARPQLGRVILFGIAFGLCSSIYDMFTFYVALLLYSFFRRVKLWQTALSLVIAFGVYSGFLYLEFGILGLPEDKYNSDLGTLAFGNIVNLMKDFKLGQIYDLSVGSFSTFAQNLGYAFFTLTTLLALIGLLAIADKKEKILLGLLFLPAILLNLYLYVGNIRWLENIRLVAVARYSYIAYPAIYLGAALTIYHLETVLQSFPRLSRFKFAYLSWAIILLIFAWHNLDVFGFPGLYVQYYWPIHHNWLDDLKVVKSNS